MEASGHLTQELRDYMMRQIPGRRLGRPDDIAGVAAMLLSDDGRWINGQVYNVNGGALMR
jgi:7-alpha-hydroxysteroid dehydrogenase